MEAAGGVPFELSTADDPEALIERVDALLVPGGDDFLPQRPYPEDVAFVPMPEERLRFDGTLLDLAIERGLPVLAVCYGMQLLALRQGGSLHHHVPVDVPEAGPHQLEDGGTHVIEVEPGSRLAAAIGAGPAAVNSRHHQAVASPGVLRVSARSEDGLIEAVELPTAPFCVGVQWHPETMALPRPLFDAFVRAAENG